MQSGFAPKSKVSFRTSGGLSYEQDQQKKNNLEPLNPEPVNGYKIFNYRMLDIE
jgi:hypothetical protein